MKEKRQLMRGLIGTGKSNLFENIFIVILAFYPLRHIFVGLDLWDTGYNYANFKYMGTEHMDPMWLFSTYLANVVGNLFSNLPNGNTLGGMNFYTGLFVSLLALVGYFFCTRVLKMPNTIVFFGELVAVSLCWCPTALLYNYLTYVLFLASAIFLYLGLVKENRYYLITAGVLLGTNVLVRFSNLPEMGMIAAVWGYDILVWLDVRKEQGKGKKTDFWQRIFRHTLWCLVGYLGALLVLYGYIHARYGLGDYFAAIARLFAMTENATDYKATSMVMGLIGTYVENLYWVIRIGVLVAGGMIVYTVLNRGKVFSVLAKCFCVALAVAMVGWLYFREFCSFLFYSYDSMLRPGVLFLMLTMLICAIRIFCPKAPKEEKLISGMLILIILLTSLGSNNKVYPSLNNLFIAAPYTLWESVRFIRNVGEKRLKLFKTNRSMTISAFPVKCLLVAFLAICFVQFGGFGSKFVFAEGTGVQETSGTVENNEVLHNINMPAERARWMTEITAFVKENALEGKEVILYGDIPSLSFYLQMPSAFNPWSDLRSYSYETMKSDMKDLEGFIREKEKEKPVVIADRKYASEDADNAGDKKWQLIADFMKQFGYEEVFLNDKFVIYR